MKVLVFTTLFPNETNDNLGVFIRERIKYLGKFCDIKVIAPVPWSSVFLPFRRYRLIARIKNKEIIDGIEVFHPRYFITPKLGMIFYGFFMFFSLFHFIKKIDRTFCFDVIDAHYVFPDGFAAVCCAKCLKKTVILSARGTDINVFPKLKGIKRQIVWALSNADKIISVSQNLKEIMIGFGISADKIIVLGNGVDADKFKQIARADARKQLNIEDEKKLLLSVANLKETKGFQYLIDGLYYLKCHRVIDCPKLIIIGDGEYKDQLLKLIKEKELQDYVTLVGAQSHQELWKWYNAVDLFCLLSMNEGRPNVILESLSCGTPVLASNVGGIPEIITGPDHGYILDSFNSEKIADGIIFCLEYKWNRERIRSFIADRTWSNVSKNLYKILIDTLEYKVNSEQNLIYHHRTLADGGEGIHIREMIQAFRDLKCEVNVIAVANTKKGIKSKNFVKIIKKLPRFVYEIAELSYNFLSYIKIRKCIKAKRPRFIYERYSLYNIAGVLAASRFKIPLILEVNSPLVYEKEKYEKLIFHNLAGFFEKYIFNKANTIIVVSNVLKDLLLKNKKLDPSKIVVMHNGVRIERFNIDNSSAIKRKLDLENKLVVGFCGFFRSWHNVNLLIEAVSKLNIKYNYDAHILLIGDGPARDDIEKFTKSVNMQHNITITGRVNDEEIPVYMSLFDIAVMPSITPYASPIKIFEYMAMSKAIIAPNMGNIREILDDGKNALLFSINDEKDFESKLESLINDSVLRTNLGKNARDKLLQSKFLWVENARNVLDIVNKIYLYNNNY